jgi:hypothetical protein
MWSALDMLAPVIVGIADNGDVLAFIHRIHVLAPSRHLLLFLSAKKSLGCQE